MLEKTGEKPQIAQGQEPERDSCRYGSRAVISIACMFDKLSHCGTRETLPIEVRVQPVMRYQPWTCAIAAPPVTCWV